MGSKAKAPKPEEAAPAAALAPSEASVKSAADQVVQDRLKMRGSSLKNAATPPSGYLGSSNVPGAKSYL